MKIEFEINDIFQHGEDVSLETAIKREIVDQILDFYGNSLKQQVKDYIVSEAGGLLRAEISKVAPGLIDSVLNETYTPIAKYGERGQPTTLLNEVHKNLVEQMVYKKATYDSDKNAFSAAFDRAVAFKMDEFKKEWLRQVDAKFVADAMAHATAEMSKRLGLGK